MILVIVYPMLTSRGTLLARLQCHLMPLGESFQLSQPEGIKVSVSVLALKNNRATFFIFLLTIFPATFTVMLMRNST